MTNRVDRLGGASAVLAFKAPCRIATTEDITLSGFQTIDGVLPTESEHESLRRVVVKNQTNTAQNGVYVMSDGAWERARDFDGNNDFVRGTRVYVWGGSTQSGPYQVTSAMDPASFVIDTDAITIELITNEVPEDGVSPTVGIGTVTTGDPGTDAEVTNSSTDPAVVTLDFTIPRGAQGASGSGTGDMLAAQNLADVGDAATAFDTIKQAASSTYSGAVRLATTTEAAALASSTLAVSPAALAAVTATTARTGLIAIAPSTAMVDGTSTSLAVTPAQAERRGQYNSIATATSTSYTLVLTDLGKLIQFSATSACQVIIPSSTSVAFSTATRVDLAQIGAGQLEVVGASTAITINSLGTLTKLSGQYAMAVLYKRDTATWMLAGALST